MAYNLDNTRTAAIHGRMFYCWEKETVNCPVYEITTPQTNVAGAEHAEIQMKTDGYMTAWMLYQLQGDEEAGKALTGENAEILHNANWQDIEKNR